MEKVLYQSGISIKLVIGKNGKIADTFSPITKPSSQKFINLIEKLIQKLKLKPSKAGIILFGSFFLKQII